MDGEKWQSSSVWKGDGIQWDNILLLIWRWIKATSEDSGQAAVKRKIPKNQREFEFEVSILGIIQHKNTMYPVLGMNLLIWKLLTRSKFIQALLKMPRIYLRMFMFCPKLRYRMLRSSQMIHLIIMVLNMPMLHTSNLQVLSPNKTNEYAHQSSNNNR